MESAKQAGQKEAVLSLIEQVEAINPLEAPTQHLDQCHGSWRLLFSTLTILVQALDSLSSIACTVSPACRDHYGILRA